MLRRGPRSLPVATRTCDVSRLYSQLDKTMKQVILGDVHDLIGTMSLILASEEPYDETWVTGDFFDSWGHNEKQAKNTAIYLDDYLGNRRNHSILGNHDVHYLYPHVQSMRCSGYTRNKLDIIRRNLNVAKIRHQMPLHAWIDDFLMTHGGVHEAFAHPVMGFNREWIDRLMTDAYHDLEAGIVTPVVKPGAARYGRQDVGGPLWLDWHSEFKPIEGLNQIVGHTPSKIRTVEMLVGKNSVNYCVDCGLRQYLVIQDGIVAVKDTPIEFFRNAYYL